MLITALDLCPTHLSANKKAFSTTLICGFVSSIPINPVTKLVLFLPFFCFFRRLDISYLFPFVEGRMLLKGPCAFFLLGHHNDRSKQHLRPQYDEQQKLTRLHCRLLEDSTKEGWVTMKGNQGALFYCSKNWFF